MKWLPFTYQGEEYGLSHLDPFEWRYTAKGSEKQPESTHRFQVTFSMHCFTRKPFLSEEIAEDLWYEGPRERRVFCFDRYQLSHRLPGIILSLGDRYCWHTEHSDFLTIELITGSGEKIEYEVYFRVTKVSGKKWLNLTIQSAYVRTKDRKTARPRRKKIRFDVIARNRQLGKRIRPGR